MRSRKPSAPSAVDIEGFISGASDAAQRKTAAPRPPDLSRLTEETRIANAHLSSEREQAAKAQPAQPGSARATRSNDLPWLAGYVREDVSKSYPLRLPEPLYLQLKWVAKQTARSMNVVCREAIEKEIARHLP